MSHEDLSLSGIRVTGEAFCDTLHKLTVAAAQDLRVQNLNSMVVRVPTHVPALQEHLFYLLSIHVPCMQSILGNPNPYGP